MKSKSFCKLSWKPCSTVPQFDGWTQITSIWQIVRLYRVSERPNTGPKGDKQARKTKTRPKGTKGDKWAISGAHQMEPPSPIQALGVNPFPSRFIIRTVPRGDFALRQWEEPITTTKWQCYCTSSNSRKFGADRPNKIISYWNVALAFSSPRDFLSFFSRG